MINKNSNPRDFNIFWKDWNYDNFQDEMQNLRKVLHLKKTMWLFFKN
jgi:hypothetical protein